MVEILLLILAVAFFARRGRGKAVGKGGLAGLLAGAEAAGIVTAMQREQLLTYAATQEPAGRRFAGATWLAIIAGLFVVAGVSLLIARNWEEFGPLLRIGAFLALLLAVGEAAIRAQPRQAALSVPLEVLWLFLPLLGIGLYAQTFQLSGDPIQPFLVWLALTAPIVWLSPRPVAASLHTGAMVATLFFGNYVVDPAASLFGTVHGPVGTLSLMENGGGSLAWALSLVLLAAIALQSLRLLPRAHRHHFVGVWLLWLWSLLLAPTPLRLQHEGWLIVATVGFATVWLVALAALDTSFEERATSMLVWLATLYGLTFTWHFGDAADGTASGPGLLVAQGVLVVAVVGALLVPPRRLSPLPSWAWAAKALLIVPVLVSLLYLGGDVRQAWQAAMIMNGILFAAAVGLMWHGSLVHEAAQVNLGVMVLVGLLITRFLDLFGSMLRSGIGFIVAGLLLAGLSWALERTRRRLIAGGAAGEVTP